MIRFEIKLFYIQIVMKEDYSIRNDPLPWYKYSFAARLGKRREKGCVKQSRKRLLSLLELRRFYFSTASNAWGPKQ